MEPQQNTRINFERKIENRHFYYVDSTGLLKGEWEGFEKRAQWRD